MNEPTVAVLGGGTFSAGARRLFLATRPKFFTASALPVLLGTALGAVHAGGIDILAFLLALASIICIHAGVNVFNDVCDEVSGNDRANDGRIHPYTGGSRFIQNGVMRLDAMRTLGVTLFVVGGGLGVMLVVLKGWAVLGFGVVGLALGIFYSMPPVWLSARGLGEAAVGVGFGVLPVMGAAWLQGGGLTVDGFLLSLPVSFWIANVLLINEVPDAIADASVGRRTLVVRLGRRDASVLYGVLGAGTVVATVGAAMTGTGTVPPWAVAGPLLLLALVRLGVRGMGASDHSDGRDALKRGIEATLGAHVIGTFWLVAAVVGSALL